VRVVERKMTLHECQSERFELCQVAFFGHALDYELSVANEFGHVIVIDLAGALAGSESRELSDLIQRLVERGERIIVVNLGAVTDVDSMGLCELVRSFVAVTRNGGMMPLVNAPEHFRRLVESCKFL
jgi:anti-sigma B factor antagonist